MGRDKEICRVLERYKLKTQQTINVFRGLRMENASGCRFQYIYPAHTEIRELEARLGENRVLLCLEGLKYVKGKKKFESTNDPQIPGRKTQA